MKTFKFLSELYLNVMALKRNYYVIPPPVFHKDCLKTPPQVKDLKSCCKFPPIFSDEDLADCGLLPTDTDIYKKPDPEVMCAKNSCLLKRNYLMIDRSIIDVTQVNSFLDKYTHKYPLYEKFMPSVKGRCVGTPMPNVAGCPAVKLVECLVTMLHFHCPNYSKKPSCQQYRAYLGMCSPFYLALDEQT